MDKTPSLFSREGARQLTGGRVISVTKKIIHEIDQIHNRPYLKSYRKHLRKNLTAAEASLWTMLKDKQLGGRKFRRQHSVGKYVLDFYCPTERLGIELDGDVHFTDAGFESDENRTAYLNRLNIKMIRFVNEDVFRHPEAVLEEIKRNFNHPCPSLK